MSKNEEIKKLNNRFRRTPICYIIADFEVSTNIRFAKSLAQITIQRSENERPLKEKCIRQCFEKIDSPIIKNPKISSNHQSIIKSIRF